MAARELTMRRVRPHYRGQATSAARGYNYQHQKLAALLLAAWQPGDPCTRCGKPMWQRWAYTRSGRRVSAIHLGHTDDKTAYRGLEHAHCNLSDGARRGNQARAMGVSVTAVRTVKPSRAW